jgi:hypothetical protein
MKYLKKPGSFSLIVLFIFVFFFGPAAQVQAATRAASVSGNWNDTTTWGGLSVPGPGDFVEIRGNVVVTIPTGYNAAARNVTVGSTPNTSGIATLILNGSLTIDSSGIVMVGAGSGRDGKFVFGPGSTISIPAGFYWNNSYIHSTATKENPAKIVGTGNIGSSSSVPGSRNEVILSNISFRNTGNIYIALRGTTGAATSRLSLTNNTFVGTGAATFGSVDTPNTTSMSITNNDFRDMPRVTILRADGGSAPYELKHNTFNRSSGVLNISPTTATGLLIDSNVILNSNIALASTSGAAVISNNFMAINRSIGQLVTLSDGGLASTATRNYFRSIANNLVPITTSGSGGSGTHMVTHNVLDADVNGGAWDKPDLFVPGPFPIGMVLSYNILIGTGEMTVGVSEGTFPDYTISNNTIAVTVPAAIAGPGHIFSPERGDNPGTIKIFNNLHRGNNSNANNPSISGANTTFGPVPQYIAFSDYNNFYNLPGTYEQGEMLIVQNGNSAKVVPGAHDTILDPMFVDETRNMGKWNLSFGSGTDSDDDGIVYLLGINGYRGAPYFDQNGPVSARMPSDLLDWVSYGFSPTNPLLQGAGDPANGSSDIGAMPVVTTAVTAPTLSTVAATSVGATTATLNGSITSTGGANATQSGFTYGTSYDLSSSTTTSALGPQTGSATFFENLTELLPDTLYYYRSYATNFAGTGQGPILYFRTATTAPVFPPTLTTQEASFVTASSALANGTITSTGNDNPSARGFVYGISVSEATTTEAGLFGTGNFAHPITGLTCNTLYHIAAYATNSQGTSYGPDVTFTTGPCDTQAPVLSNGAPSGELAFGTTSTNLSVVTDENATCKYNTASGTAYSLMPNNFSATGGTSHSQNISGLLNGQSYNYYVKCQDAAGNANPADYTISFSVSGGGGTPPIDQGMVGYWKFDEGSGQAASDISGNSNNATLVNSPVWAAGKSGTGLQFSGNNYISIPSSPVLSGGSGLTVSMWVNTSAIGSKNILSKRHGTTPYSSYNMTVDTQTNNRASCSVTNNSGASASAGAAANTFTRGVWQHIVCVYNGSNVRMYTNGVHNGFTNNLTGTVYSSNNLLYIPMSNSAFSGSLDEVRIYNRALSAEEVAQLYGM